MESAEIVEALKQTTLFAGLKEEDLEQVARKVKVRQFFADDVIVWQGQPSTSLFLITNGIVVVKRIVRETESVLAYLMPGNTFGEVGILENQPRSASVVALSEVDALVIRREDLLNILHQHPTVTIELARILGHYLLQSNRRLSNEHSNTREIVLINTEENSGGTSFSALLAQRLADTKGTPTAFMEYPNPWRALNGYQLNKNTTVYHHGDGYDILLPAPEPYLPSNTRMTLLMDKLRGTYQNLVVKIHGEVDEAANMLLEQANQIIIMAPPTKKGLKDLEVLQKSLKGKIRAEETSVVSVLNFSHPNHKLNGVSPQVDIQIPFMKDFPLLQLPNRTQTELPEAMEDALTKCLERLERTNSIGIFIPTTMEGDQAVDTSKYRQRALDFMAERFGGATCKEASGVWHSEQLGLVGEVIYIVHSYLTSSDLTRYLDEVVDFIKWMKHELQQEAMALEVNNKLTLI
ncbi:MAG: cyclic nucleotide-binding domain-containing protein [Bacteroidota bacterium]